MYYWIFRPTRRLLGPVGAMLTVFLVSGLIHELLITVPARSAYGGPTAYFLLQAVGFLIEAADSDAGWDSAAALRGESSAWSSYSRRFGCYFPPRSFASASCQQCA